MVVGACGIVDEGIGLDGLRVEVRGEGDVRPSLGPLNGKIGHLSRLMLGLRGWG